MSVIVSDNDCVCCGHVRVHEIYVQYTAKLTLMSKFHDKFFQICYKLIWVNPIMGNGLIKKN